MSNNGFPWKTYEPSRISHPLAPGTMDPAGLGNVKAGKICGIISVVLLALVIVFYFVFGAAMFGIAASEGAFEQL